MDELLAKLDDGDILNFAELSRLGRNMLEGLGSLICWAHHTSLHRGFCRTAHEHIEGRQPYRPNSSSTVACSSISLPRASAASISSEGRDAAAASMRRPMTS